MYQPSACPQPLVLRISRHSLPLAFGQNMELKLKKDLLDLKRQLMDIGKRKDEL